MAESLVDQRAAQMAGQWVDDWVGKREHRMAASLADYWGNVKVVMTAGRWAALMAALLAASTAARMVALKAEM